MKNGKWVGAACRALASVSVLGSGSAEAADPATLPAPPVPIEALAEIPYLSDPILSPDGRKIAMRINSKGREVLAVYDVALGPDQKSTIIPQDGGIAWFSWAGSDRLLIGRRMVVFMLGVLPLPITRLNSYELESGKTVPVEAGAGFVGDTVIHTDPVGRFILLSAQKDFDDSPSIWRVDLATGKGVEVQKKKADIWSWFADADGKVRGGISYKKGGWQIYVTDPVTGEIRKGTAGRIETDRESAIDSIYISPASGTGVIVTNERTGRFGVYEYDLAAQSVGKPIFEHPEVDVTAPQISSATGEIEAIYYEDDQPRVEWLKSDLKQVQAQIDRTLKNKTNRIVTMSRDRNVALVWSGSASDAGTYYVFDRKAKRMDMFASPYEKLIDATLGEVKPIRYQARDGLSIPGYLALPPGRDPRNLPLIVMPHGGPFARTSLAFNPLVQLLATRGYAVLEPNFRGSTGYGRDFVEKGYGEWGARMQDDLDDGVAWLAKNGVIDPKRVCIFGSSYGGYAALWGAIRNPDTYRCAISFAGVTDVSATLKRDAKMLVAQRYSKEWRRRIEGEQKRDLAAVSPLQQAARLTVPVLVAHGERDTNVPAEQSHKLLAALKARGAKVQGAFYAQEGHGFETSENMLDFMTRLETFLALHNPSDINRPPAGAHEATLIGGKVEPAILLAATRKKPKGEMLAMRFKVTDDGRVTNCAVTTGSGDPGIDSKACAVAEEQLQYRPQYTADGSPQEVWQTHEVRWPKLKK